MKNKIAFLIKPKKFEIDFQKINKLEKDYVLVKIYKSGVCGSDLHYFRHGGLGSFKSKMPLSLGHEASGIIVDRNGSSFKNYSKVTIDPLNHSCCPHSKKNNPHQCEIWGDKINICPHGTYLGANNFQGTFREYIVLHKSQLTLINDDKVFNLSHLFEPLNISMYAVQQANINFDKEKNVLIFGAGTIGLFIAEVLKALGLKNITIVDKLKYRLKFAESNLKIKTIDLSKNNNLLKMKNYFDVIFDTITNDFTFEKMPYLLNYTGKMVIVGIPIKDFAKINPHQFRIKELQFINVRRSNIKMHKALEFYFEKKLKLEKYNTHDFNLNDIQNAFKLSSSYKDEVIRCSVSA